MKLLIKNGHLIDPAAPENTGMSVLIEDGRVSGWLRPGEDAPNAGRAGAQIHGESRTLGRGGSLWYGGNHTPVTQCAGTDGSEGIPTAPRPAFCEGFRGAFQDLAELPSLILTTEGWSLRNRLQCCRLSEAFLWWEPPESGAVLLSSPKCQGGAAHPVRSSRVLHEREGDPDKDRGVYTSDGDRETQLAHDALSLVPAADYLV